MIAALTEEKKFTELVEKWRELATSGISMGVHLEIRTDAKPSISL